METPTDRPGPHLYTLPDLCRTPGRSSSTDRQDPVITAAARNVSDPAASGVTIRL